MSFVSRLLLATSLVLLLGQATGEEATGPKGQEIERLVRQLGSDSFAEREAASKRLAEIGGPALPALRRARRSEDPEIRRRAGQLVADLEVSLREPSLVVKHPGVTSLAFSPDGRLLASGSWSGAIRLWNAKSLLGR